MQHLLLFRSVTRKSHKEPKTQKEEDSQKKKKKKRDLIFSHESDAETVHARRPVMNNAGPLCEREERESVGSFGQPKEFPNNTGILALTDQIAIKKKAKKRKNKTELFCPCHVIILTV